MIFKQQKLNLRKFQNHALVHLRYKMMTLNNQPININDAKSSSKKLLMTKDCCSFFRLQRTLKDHQIMNHVTINKYDGELFAKKINLRWSYIVYKLY